MKSLRPKKIIYLLRSPRTNWASVDLISANLAKIYLSWRNSTTMVRTIELTPRNSRRIMSEIARRSWASDADVHLITLDHSLDVRRIARWTPWMNAERTFVHIHCFGDVLIRKKEFQEAVRISGVHLDFFAASRAFQKTLSEWLGHARVHLIPFPVAPRFFESKMKRPRPGSLHFAYIGRMSVDKGAGALLAWWDREKSAGNLSGATLTLLGSREDSREYSALSAREWNRERGKLRRFLSNPPPGVRILGPRPAGDLAKFMRQVDYLISFSTFALEDFGLAVAEGASSGAGLWISAWAGHLDYSSAPNVHFIPVKRKAPPQLRTDRLSSAGLIQPSWQCRERQRAWARKRYSYSAVALRLRQVIFDASPGSRTPKGENSKNAKQGSK